MSRLTNEQLAALERIAVGDDGVRPIMFPWICRAIDELRERRAADQAASDLAVFAWLRGQMFAYQCLPAYAEGGHMFEMVNRALSLLDRLLARSTP